MDAVKFADLARNLTTSTGVGPITLGPTVAGFQSIATALLTNEQFYYCIQGITNPTEREVGRGTMLADGTIERTAPVGAPVNFSPGAKNISVVVSAKWFADANTALAAVDPSIPGRLSAAEVTVADHEARLDAAEPVIVDHGNRLTAAEATVAGHTTSINTINATLEAKANRAAISAAATANRKQLWLAEAGREGRFMFSTANLSAFVTADPAQGVYIAPDSDPTGASGAWVRQYEHRLNVLWFGAVGDGVTLDRPAFIAVHNFIGAQRRIGYGYNGGVMSCFIPFGAYLLGDTAFENTYPIHWIGEGDGGGSNAASVLIWTNQSAGIVNQFVDTTGETGTQAPVAFSGSSSIWEGLHVHGGFAGGDEAERHGIKCRSKALLMRCNFFNWAGDGINIDADVAQPIKGNANIVTVMDCMMQDCRNGLYAVGGDANACAFTNISTVGCRRFGVFDNSFLGNQHNGGHHDANARQAWNTGAAGRPCSYVWHNGHQYFCIHGQEAWASVNAPSGTTADNQGWGWWKTTAGAEPATGVPAWFNGINVRSGGPMLINGVNNASRVDAPHIEVNGVSQFDQQVVIIGSSTADCVRVTGGLLLRNRLGKLRSFGGFIMEGGLEVWGDFRASDPTNTLGPHRAGQAVADATTILATRSTSHILEARVADINGALAATYASLGFYDGFGIIANVQGARSYRFRINHADKLYLDNQGMTVEGTLQQLKGQVNAPVDNTEGVLEVGRYNNTGITSAIVRPNAAAANFLLRSMDNANQLVITNAGVDFPNPPTGPTQAPGNNSTRLATTAFVQAAIAALIDGAPGAIDTLNELAAALGDDPNFATTVTNALAAKLDDSQATVFGLNMLGAADAAAGTALLNVFTTTLKGLAPASGGGTANFLRADGTWAAPVAVAAAGGADRNIQFNNATAIDGAAHADIDAQGDIRLDSSQTPVTPGADQITLIPQRLNASGGRVFPRWRSEDAINITVATHQGRNTVAWGQAIGNATTAIASVGMVNMTAVGTATARNVASTSRLTRAKRLAYVSAGTAGAVAGLHNGTGNTQWTVGGAAGAGFLAVFRFAVSDAALVAGAHAIIGLRNATAAPTAATNPNTLTNIIALCQNNGSTDWHIDYGGSAAQTPVDTGMAVNNTDLYELVLYARPDVNNKVTWRLENLSTGAVASGELTGTAGTALPANTTFLGPVIWRSNNATAAAVGIDIVSYYIESDI